MRAGDGTVVLGAPVGYAGFVKEKLERRESARYSSAAPPTQGPPFRVCAAEILPFIAQNHVHAPSCQHHGPPGAAVRVRLHHLRRSLPHLGLSAD